jgi:hypothetical protein
MAMEKRAYIAAITILLIFVSLTVSAQVIQEDRANPSWGWFSGVVPAEPSADKPILVIESPGNYSACAEGNVTLNFTVIKPNSWNHTVLPFGSCANGRIESVNVSLNGLSEFQESLDFNDLNGGGSWNKSYSINMEGIHSGINSLSVIVFAHAFYIGNNSSNTVSIYPMNVTDTLHLISGSSPTSNPAPSDPEFTVKLVGSSLVEFTIKNQQLYSLNGAALYPFYNIRYKNHSEADNWVYLYQYSTQFVVLYPGFPDSKDALPPSGSEYTVLNYQNFSSYTIVDFQVELLLYNLTHIVPSGGNPTPAPQNYKYEYTLIETSNWSAIQIATVHSSSFTTAPSPTQTETVEPSPTMIFIDLPHPPDLTRFYIFVSLTILAVVTAGMIVYFKKIKKQK